MRTSVGESANASARWRGCGRGNGVGCRLWLCTSVPAVVAEEEEGIIEDMYIMDIMNLGITTRSNCHFRKMAEITVQERTEPEMLMWKLK